MSRLQVAERVFAAIGTLASIIGLYYVLAPETETSWLINSVPPSIPTGLSILIFGILFILFSVTLVFAGRNWESGQRTLTDLAKTQADLAEANGIIASLKIENESLSELLHSGPDASIDSLQTRIIGLLKSGPHEFDDIVRKLGLNTEERVHTQAVMKALGEMDKVACNVLGRYEMRKLN